MRWAFIFSSIESAAIVDDSPLKIFYVDLILCLVFQTNAAYSFFSARIKDAKIVYFTNKLIMSRSWWSNGIDFHAVYF